MKTEVQTKKCRPDQAKGKALSFQASSMMRLNQNTFSGCKLSVSPCSIIHKNIDQHLISFI